jgi:hypothetical protein
MSSLFAANFTPIGRYARDNPESLLSHPSSQAENLLLPSGTSHLKTAFEMKKMPAQATPSNQQRNSRKAT